MDTLLGFIIIGVIIGLIITILINWEVGIPVLIVGIILNAIIKYLTRIDSMPRLLPNNLINKSTRLDDLITEYVHIYDTLTQKKIEYDKLTTLQKSKRTTPDPDNTYLTINDKYRKKLLYIEGVVNDITDTLNVEIRHDISVGNSGFPRKINISFPKKWERAIRELNKNDNVKILGKFYSITKGSHTLDNGRVLVKHDSEYRWYRDESTFQFIECEVRGKYITHAEDIHHEDPKQSRKPYPY